MDRHQGMRQVPGQVMGARSIPCQRGGLLPVPPQFFPASGGLSKLLAGFRRIVTGRHTGLEGRYPC
jgi:hypothetical protein